MTKRHFLLTVDDEIDPVGAQYLQEALRRSAFTQRVRSAEVRQLVGEDSDEKMKRFREAVDRVFHKMTINSNEDTAAWYTIRDWL